MSNDAWDELIYYVEAGEVIPIVGGGLVTLAEEREGFDTWLGRKLAEKLEVDRLLNEPYHVNQVTQAYFTNFKSSNSEILHHRIKRIK